MRSIFSEIASIIGSSGCGKSTLANIIAGFDEDFIGEIKLNMSEKSLRDMIKEFDGVQIVTQNPYDAINTSLSVFEVIGEPLSIKKMQREYILNGWYKCISSVEVDVDYSIALPKPFTPPCYDGIFKTLFYWDTYFSNLGLIKDNLINVAKDNVENFFYVIKKIGFVPNALSTAFFNRSQPPLLTLCVKDIFNETNDVLWLEEHLDTLIIEYDFWICY